MVPVGMGCSEIRKGMMGETCPARERGPVGRLQPGQLDVLEQLQMETLGE